MNSFTSSPNINCNVQSSAFKDCNQFFSTANTFDTSDDPSIPEMFVRLGQPFVTPEGFVSLFVAKDTRVDISANQTVVVNTNGLKCSVDGFGQNLGVIHPMGRVLRDIIQNCVHIESGLRLSKMADRGITFTSLRRSLVYLVDCSGCKTTTERYRKLDYDFVSQIFDTNCLNTDDGRQLAVDGVNRHQFETEGSDQIWFITGLRIRYNMKTGDLMISNSFGKIVIHMNSAKCQLKITTPSLRVMANFNTDGRLQVVRPHRRDEQRVTITADHFNVRCGSQKAAFDDKDQLVLS